MKRMVSQLFESFVYLFCLANFVVGTVSYVLNPSQGSPVPDVKVMLLVGVASALVTIVNGFRGLSTV